ncbi:MAG: glycosyltransferase [Terriglobales bacterium]
MEQNTKTNHEPASELIKLTRVVPDGPRQLVTIPADELIEMQRKIADLQEELEAKEDQLRTNEATLQIVLNSKGWRLLNRYRSVRNRFRSILAARLQKRFRSFIEPEQYALWIERHEKPAQDPLKIRAAIAKFHYRPLISIVMPVYNTAPVLLEKAIASVTAQLYENWELCLCDDASTAQHIRPYLEQRAAEDPRIKVHFSERNEGISGASNRALELAQGEFVGLLDHDDELSPDALYHVLGLLQLHPEADIIYSDEDKLEPDGRRSDPFFKPDWSPEYLLACMYTCHFGVYRKQVLDEIGGFRHGFEGSQDYDLMLRATERTQRVFHIPKVLYHWRKWEGSTAAAASAKSFSSEAGRRALVEHMQRRGIQAEVICDRANRYRVQPAIIGEPLVSIIIPTKDRIGLLSRCIRSIEERTSYPNYEIVVIDNNSNEPSTIKYLAELRHRVVPLREAFNFSRINNFGVRHANGNYLLFLNNDVSVISPGWLTAMLEYCQFPEIGAVGAKLYYPNRTIQHGGVILGLGGVAGHAFKRFPWWHRGYFDSLSRVKNYSAVTAACMMVRRDVFEQVGGFDENLSVAFNDVDFCLRVREAGFRVVWTPYAELFHYESASRGFDLDTHEVRYMQKRWGRKLTEDPYYNPNLTLKHEDYRIRL